VGESGVVGDNQLKKIRKYQRISSIVGNVLENYAEIDKNTSGFGTNKARIIAVWSPSGGSGKTTVALAYSANKISSGKQLIYLNLENFSSTSAYFQENGKSISKVFEKLETNVHMFLTGISQHDLGSGITYFCGPDNYDDINILTASDIEIIIKACTAEIDELVIDLSNQCDEKVQKVFDLADTVFLVCDSSNTSQVKLKQFINQHNVYGKIKDKIVLVNNKGAKAVDQNLNRIVHLPLVQSFDPVSIFKTLSSGNFDW